MLTPDKAADALDWVINSPLLLSAPVQPKLWELDTSRDVIEEVRLDPSPLLQFLKSAKRQNLGTLFESLVFYWLDQLPEVQILTTNLQIRDDKTTYGELDLLFEYAGQIYQWELAIKFYACDGDPLNEADWLGPLRRDNLKRKLDRMFDHQMKVSKLEQAAPILNKLNVDGNDLNVFPFVKGCLYDPISNGVQKRPIRISDNSLKSYWISLQEFTSADIDKRLDFPTVFSVLEKKDWLSPVKSEDWQDYSAVNLQNIITNMFEQNATPKLVAFGKDHTHTELSRIFIMPDDWSSLNRI